MKAVVSTRKAQIGEMVVVIDAENRLRIGRLGKNEIEYEDGTECIFVVVGPVIELV